jgi:dephospho-CoA kinase
MLLGLTGRNGSGKSAIIDWFAKRGYGTSSCSDSIRHWLRNKGREVTRENLIEGGRNLRAAGGPGVLAEMLLAMIGEEENHAIDSIRTPAEVEALRTRDDFLLIEIRAGEAIRWDRLSSRGRAGDSKTFEEFKAADQAELEAHDESGQALLATAKLADVVIHNDGTLEELHAQLDALTASFDD